QGSVGPTGRLRIQPGADRAAAGHRARRAWTLLAGPTFTNAPGTRSDLPRGIGDHARRSWRGSASDASLTRMGRIDDRLRELGIALPPPRAPLANYGPARRVGNLVYTAGQGA